MPRVAIPITQIKAAGVAPPAQTVGNPAEDHSLSPNDGNVFLEVQNTDAAVELTVTVRTPRKVGDLDVAEVEVKIPKEATRMIGPFPPSVFNQSDGKVYVDLTSEKLKIRAYRI